jgi:PAS domain S-box-containing protein
MGSARCCLAPSQRRRRRFRTKHSRSDRPCTGTTREGLDSFYDGPVPASSQRSPDTDLAAVFAPYEQMSELLDPAPGVMFCVKDRSSRYVVVNHGFAERVGKSDRRAVIGATAHELFPADLADRYEAQDRVILETGRAMRNEVELITDRFGEAGWFVTNKRPVMAANGAVVGVIVVSVDLRTAHQSGDGMDALASVIALARQHLARTVEVAEMATVAGLSTTQLERRMKRAFGMSPQQYLLRVRVDEATRRLTTTGEALADIAHSCGWYDQSAFTRQFTRAAGYTPGDYRARYQRPAAH